MIELVFLGTSSMVPTKERNHSSVLISFKGNNILVDCGEGTQRQLKFAGVGISKINKILISHWHGDHVLGLPGLIQTLATSDYEGVLEIYGPKGTKEKFKHMFKAFEFDQNKINLEIKEINKGRFFENNDFVLEVLPLEHSVPCLGYNFIEKDRRRINLKKAKKIGLKEGPLLGKLQSGKTITFNGKKIKPDDVSYVVKGGKVSFVSDTLVCKNAYTLAKGADLLICESTYCSDLEEKSEEYFHMTAKQAASIANKSDVKQLILTHISARYKDAKEVENDAKDIFEDVKCSYDFMKVKI
ncbi:ribonuclease Z [Candidatus Woesearchaeota archaeon B3_Woes]|nr:MAG: ribonuclease Z [Candidatus Woesearchaeota archaeon B3_Woes]